MAWKKGLRSPRIRDVVRVKSRVPDRPLHSPYWADRVLQRTDKAEGHLRNLSDAAKYLHLRAAHKSKVYRAGAAYGPLIPDVVNTASNLVMASGHYSGLSGKKRLHLSPLRRVEVAATVQDRTARIYSMAAKPQRAYERGKHVYKFGRDLLRTASIFHHARTGTAAPKFQSEKVRRGWVTRRRRAQAKLRLVNLRGAAHSG